MLLVESHKYTIYYIIICLSYQQSHIIYFIHQTLILQITMLFKCIISPIDKQKLLRLHFVIKAQKKTAIRIHPDSSLKFF